MVDSHTHLYLKEYFPDGGFEATERAIKAGVNRLVLPNIDMESADALLKLHEAFPQNTFVAAGLHPTEVKADWKATLREILDRFSDEKFVAIGEIGIDLHWEQDYLHRQMDAFGEQLEMAKSTDIPAIIHSRDALMPTLEVLAHFAAEPPKLIFHSYSYSAPDAGRILDLLPESMFGFNGVITFKNASEVREAARFVGIHRILSETDSPFLTPVPHRGKTNESAYIPYIVDAIGAATSTPSEEAREIIDCNSERIFGLPPLDRQ